MYVELHREAEAEINGHAEFYEREVPGLGLRFLHHIECALALVKSQPLLGRKSDGPFRRLVLSEFPFSIIYVPEAERVWIIAVAHQRRRPGYWRTRLDLA